MAQNQLQSPALSLVDRTDMRRKQVEELQAWQQEALELNQMVEMVLEIAKDLDDSCVTSTQEITRIKLLLECFITRNNLVNEEWRACVRELFQGLVA